MRSALLTDRISLANLARYMMLCADASFLRRIASLKLVNISTAMALPPVQDSSNLPDCAFLKPQSLAPSLKDVGLAEAISQQISSIYMTSALRLKDDYRILFRRASATLKMGRQPTFDDTKLQSLLEAAYKATYDRVLASWRDVIIKTLVPRVVEIRRLHAQATPRHPHCPFNQNALPILVDFFERNAFPSPSQKSRLASRTGMNYRQIAVWFQNRRHRFRKDGKPLKRDAVFAVLPPEFESVVTEVLSDEELGLNCIGSMRNECDTPTHTSYELNSERPLHAYPSSYPPSCSYNPFPIHPDQRAFNTVWDKPIRMVRPCDHSLVDMAELVELFSKLSIGSRRRPSRNEESTKSSCSLASLVPRAPLPALISVISNPATPETVVSCVSDKPAHQVRSQTSSSHIYSAPIVPATHVDPQSDKDSVDCTDAFPSRRVTSTSSTSSQSREGVISQAKAIASVASQKSIAHSSSYKYLCAPPLHSQDILKTNCQLQSTVTSLQEPIQEDSLISVQFDESSAIASKSSSPLARETRLRTCHTSTGCQSGGRRKIASLPNRRPRGSTARQPVQTPSRPSSPILATISRTPSSDSLRSVSDASSSDYEVLLTPPLPPVVYSQSEDLIPFVNLDVDDGLNIPPTEADMYQKSATNVALWQEYPYSQPSDFTELESLFNGTLAVFDPYPRCYPHVC